MAPAPVVKPSDGDVNLGPEFLAILWTTTTLAFLFVAARMFVRLKMLAFVGIIVDTVAVSHGLGRHEYYLTLDQIQQATKYNYLAIPWNLMSSAMAKVSVCFFLLHVNHNKTMAYVLHTISVLLVLFAAATTAILFGQCNPPEALWTLALRDDCINPEINASVGLAQSIFFAIADASLALFPFTFLWRLKITRRTKLALGFVLGLGLLAAAFGAVRCADLQEIASREDVLFSTVDLGIWSFLEANITIIAACIPPLYAVFRTALGNKSSAGQPTHLSHSYRGESKAGGVWAPPHGSGPRSKIRSKVRSASASEGFEFAGMPPRKRPTESERKAAAAEAVLWESESSHNGSTTPWDSLGKDDRPGLAVSDGPRTRGSEDSEEDILPKQKLGRPGNERGASRAQGHQSGDNVILRTTEVIITREDRAEGADQERLEARDVF